MTEQSTIRRIAVSTGGGDAPGLNAVIRAVVLGALKEGWEVFGVKNSYEGLLDLDGLMPLTRESVKGITHRGGTILGTTNKGNPFDYPVKQEDGTVVTEDRSDLVVSNFKKAGLDALVSIGGDGSLSIANKFFKKGIPVIGVPKTIDNDLMATDFTFGFDTAVSTATDAIDKLHPTAEAHQRVMCVELMGRYAGWIALYAGFAGTADVILLPEIPFDIEKVCEKVREREARGRMFTIVVVAEGAKPKGGEMATKGKEVGREVRLGGIAEQVADAIGARMNKETRSLVLGHLQRGGNPSTFDRALGLRFGGAAVRAVKAGEFGSMVALRGGDVLTVSLEEATKEMKAVPLDHDIVQTARSFGVSFGD
ncbi:MAG: 6-phosphofructokinase [Planctomycetota bacterium]|nr:6-phosphofructokinase [Planctomycetota bacterium]